MQTESKDWASQLLTQTKTNSYIQASLFYNDENTCGCCHGYVSLVLGPFLAQWEKDPSSPFLPPKINHKSEENMYFFASSSTLPYFQFPQVRDFSGIT